MSIPRKPSTQQTNPQGDFPELPELSAFEQESPQLVSYVEKLKEWWFSVRKVLKRREGE